MIRSNRALTCRWKPPRRRRCCRRPSAKPSPRLTSAFASATPPPCLHLLEQVRVVAADFELVGPAADLYELPTPEVARDAGNGIGVDDRRAMDLPELLGIELLDQFLDRLADQRLEGLCLHARVLFVGCEEQDVGHRDQLQLLAHACLNPLQPAARLGRARGLGSIEAR